MTDPNDATVGERLVKRISLAQTLLDDNEQLHAEIARLRLTDEEREALESEVELAEYQRRHEAATLRGLLVRTKE